MPGLEAGSLDRRLTIRLAGAASRSGPLKEPTRAVTEVTVWANKHDVSDAERVAAQGVQAECTTRFRIRYSSDVSAVNAMSEVVCEGRTYEVTAVKEIGRREGFELSTVAKADTTP